jgi:hypothetical protein
MAHFCATQLGIKRSSRLFFKPSTLDTTTHFPAPVQNSSRLPSHELDLNRKNADELFVLNGRSHSRWGSSDTGFDEGENKRDRTRIRTKKGHSHYETYWIAHFDGRCSSRDFECPIGRSALDNRVLGCAFGFDLSFGFRWGLDHDSGFGSTSDFCSVCKFGFDRSCGFLCRVGSGLACGLVLARTARRLELGLGIRSRRQLA